MTQSSSFQVNSRNKLHRTLRGFQCWIPKCPSHVQALVSMTQRVYPTQSWISSDLIHWWTKQSTMNTIIQFSTNATWYSLSWWSISEFSFFLFCSLFLLRFLRFDMFFRDFSTALLQNRFRNSEINLIKWKIF